MKKTAALIFALFALALPLCADGFTDIIQFLAVQIACIGTYSSTQAGGGWYDDPFDYYEPWMMADYFAIMSGSKTRTETFYGICFDYAEYAYNDIEKYKRLYNECGMHTDQYFIVTVDSDPVRIDLKYPSSRENSTEINNGIPVRLGGQKNVKTHKLESDGIRATEHAWLWIMRDDGVWFWIDPTWTDNAGYVVWGCVYDGEEIQLKPDFGLCLEYPLYLNSLPTAPPYGSSRPQPPPQVVQVPPPRPLPVPSAPPAPSPAPSEPPPPPPAPSAPPVPSAPPAPSPSSSSLSSSSSGFRSYRWGLSLGVSKPVSWMIGDDNSANIGLSVSLETGNGPLLLLLQGDYYAFNTQSLLASAAIGWQFANIFGIYAGGGLGAGSHSVDLFGFEDPYLAWKVFGGVRLMLGQISLRADVSYVRDEGIILGAHAGIMF